MPSISAEMILNYVRQRKEKGISNVTVNMEIGILRRVLKRAKHWSLVAAEIPCLPKKQVLDNGALRWVARQGTTGSAIGDALLSVRAVRNNVFDGGKFPDVMVTDPVRDEQLLRDCLAVLKGLLELRLPRNVVNIFGQDMP